MDTKTTTLAAVYGLEISELCERQAGGLQGHGGDDCHLGGAEDSGEHSSCGTGCNEGKSSSKLDRLLNIFRERI